MDWAPSSLFLAQMCQSLGPFLEWSLAGDSLVIRCRDRLVYNMAKEKYIASKDREKKIRNEVMEYFEVKRKTFLILSIPKSTFIFVPGQYLSETF